MKDNKYTLGNFELKGRAGTVGDDNEIKVYSGYLGDAKFYNTFGFMCHLSDVTLFVQSTHSIGMYKGVFADNKGNVVKEITMAGNMNDPHRPAGVTAMQSIIKAYGGYEVPTTGVFQINHAEHIYDELADAPTMGYEKAWCDTPEDEREDMDWGDDNSTTMLGVTSCNYDDPDWLFRYRGEHGESAYKPDPNAEYVGLAGESNIQVIRSQWVIRGAACSPCYPGQGDGDSPVDNGILMYALPPDVYGDQEDVQDIKNSIFKLEGGK